MTALPTHTDNATLADVLRSLADQHDKGATLIGHDTLRRWALQIDQLLKRQMGQPSVVYLQDEAALNAAVHIAHAARAQGDTHSPAFRAAAALMAELAPHVTPKDPAA